MMTPQRIKTRALTIHLLRGLGAVCLIAFAFTNAPTPGYLGGALTLAAFWGALILLRGCPMCWVAGLCGIAARSPSKERSK